MFTESSTGQFQNTALGDLLRTDHPASLRNWAVFLGAPFAWQTGGARDKAIMTGKPGIEESFLIFHPLLMAPPRCGTSPMADRCDIRGGDFFDGVPEGADAYVLNRVIHD